jgi:hypothetical protein
MTDDPSGSSGRSRLQNQTDDILNEDTSSVELVEQLDFGFVKANDQYAD